MMESLVRAPINLYHDTVPKGRILNRLSKDLHNIAEQAREKYSPMQVDFTFNDPKDPNRFYFRSDHYNFAKKNIPSMFYFSGVHDDYHTVNDTADRIDYPLFLARTQLIFAVAWELANAAERPKLDK